VKSVAPSDLKARLDAVIGKIPVNPGL